MQLVIPNYLCVANRLFLALYELKQNHALQVHCCEVLGLAYGPALFTSVSAVHLGG